MALGVIVGTGSELQNYPEGVQPCEIPAGSTITQEISFPNNRFDRPGNSIVTAALPSSSRYAEILAGLSAPKGERMTALQCLFGIVPSSPVDMTQEGNFSSFAMRTNYITYSILDPLSVAGDGLQLTAQTYATNTLLDWPAGTKVVLQVQASGRQLTYSTPPSHRDAKMLTWSWTLAHYSGFPDYPPIFLVLPDNPSNFITGVRPKPISVTVPLGPGEHLAALVQYGQLNRFKQIDGHYYVNIGLSLESLLPGWLGFTAATLSLLFLLRRYFRGIRIRLCSLAVALLAPTLPLLGYISVNWNSSITPIPAAIALLFTLFSILFFRRVLRSVPLRDHQPALTGRRAGIGSWLPLASLPVAAIVVAVALFPPARIDPAQPDGTPPGLLTVLDIIVASTLVWAVSILVLTFTRTSLRAISVWTTSEGSLADTGAVGAVVARCYHLATGAVVAVSAYAVGYGLAKPLGEAVSAYRVGAASA